LFKAAKILVSVSLLILVLSFADIGKFLEVISNLEMKWLLAGMSLGFIRIFIGIYRLRFILKNYFDELEYKRVAVVTFIASFYNLFLPTALGGDVPKVFLLSKRLGKKTNVAACVIIERYFGFFTLSLLSLTSLFFSPQMISLNKHLTTSIFLISLFFLVSLSIFLFDIHKIIKYFESKIRFKSIKFLLNATIKISRQIKKLSFKKIIAIFFLSLIYQYMGIVSIYFFGLSADTSVSFSFYLLAIPLIWFITMIPATISGFGLREGAFIYIFSIVGMSLEKALLLNILFIFVNFLVGITGGILNIFESAKHNYKMETKNG